MSKVSRALIGTIVLPMSLLPTAALAATTDPVIATTQTAPAVGAAGDTPPTQAPQDQPTTAAPTTAPASPTAAPDPFKNPLPLKVTPKSGPAGTVVKVSPTAKCVGETGAVGTDVVLELIDISKIDAPGDAAVAAHATAKTGRDGSWSTLSLTVPKTAKVDTEYGVLGFCFQAGAGEPNVVAVYANDVEYDFVVTGAPKAPVAKPVTKNPSFTG